MKFLKDVSRISGIFFVVLSIWVIVTASQFTHVIIRGADPLGPAFFPNLLAIVMILLSCFLIIFGEKKKEEEEEPFVWKSLLVTLSTIITYIVLFQIIGFIIPTLLLVFGLCMYFDRTRWKTAILFSLIGTTGWYIVFREVLGILLPTIWL